MPETTNKELNGLLVTWFMSCAVMVLAVALARNFEIVSWDEQVAMGAIVAWFGYWVFLVAFLWLDANIKDEFADQRKASKPLVSDNPRDGLPVR
jgi:uncharacterized membrane protein